MHFCRHRVAHLPGRAFLWALLYHDVSRRGRRHQLQESRSGNCALLGLLPDLDSTTILWLESLWTRGTRNHLLGRLDDQDGQQHLLHRLPLHLLPHSPVPRHRLLLQKTAAGCQTGEMSSFGSPLYRTVPRFILMNGFKSESRQSSQWKHADWGLHFLFIFDKNQHFLDYSIPVR